jgi:hypothetical protein
VANETVMGKILITVALDTESHLKFPFRRNPVLVRHITVASAAIETSSGVNLVVEINEIGQIIDPYPAYRFLLLKMASQFLYLWIMNDDVLMAEHTGLKGRDLG